MLATAARVHVDVYVHATGAGARALCLDESAVLAGLVTAAPELTALEQPGWAPL